MWCRDKGELPQRRRTAWVRMRWTQGMDAQTRGHDEGEMSGPDAPLCPKARGTERCGRTEAQAGWDAQAGASQAQWTPPRPQSSFPVLLFLIQPSWRKHLILRQDRRKGRGLLRERTCQHHMVLGIKSLNQLTTLGTVLNKHFLSWVELSWKWSDCILLQ